MTTEARSRVGGDDEVRPGSRRDRLRRPRARDVLRETATEFGVCVRPVLLRRTDTTTGETAIIETPCGSTRQAVCPPCADKARRLRAQQCREGWHLAEEPDLSPDPATEGQRDLMAQRAACTANDDDAGTEAVDEALTASGVRGGVEHAKRRTRSTRRRADVPDLPRRPATASTLGRTFTDPNTGATFRPSMFLTLTLPSYGAVHADGTPRHPARYDYTQAARDALHFGKLLDRFAQNLRRVAGYDVQYFATVEPQRRGAPHAHYAIRGTLPRTIMRQVIAATYAHIWWPPSDRVVYDDGRHPHWLPSGSSTGAGEPAGGGGYVDPDTGQALPTWAEALDALAPDDADASGQEPLHTVRFGTQADVQGLLAGSEKAERAIGYLVKYLIKDLGADLEPTNDADELGEVEDQGDDHGGDPAELAARSAYRTARSSARAASRTRRADHVARLVQALRYEPCSPRCANWLRYGIQPHHARPGMHPGACRSKAHRPTHLGYGGRRVLVSRKWTAKDLRDHRHDRRAHVLAVLGHTAPDNDTTGTGTGTGPADDSATRPRVFWELAKPTDPDVPPAHHRLLRRIATAVQQRTAYHRARDGTKPEAAQDVSTETAA